MFATNENKPGKKSQQTRAPEFLEHGIRKQHHYGRG
jgi:hypothetical protein